MERARFTPEMEARGRAAILAAWEAGYTHFDHADIYGNGISEEIFGRVLRDVPGMRERVLVASKCGIRWAGDPDPAAPHRWDFSRDHLVRSCEGSLRRLGIERLDLFMLHRPDYLADPDEIAAAFAELHAAGKVREFGVSNFRPSQVAGAAPRVPAAAAREPGRGPPAATRAVRGRHARPVPRARRHAGVVEPARGRPARRRRGARPGDPRASVHAAVLAALDAAAQRHGVSRTVVALAWLLRHPAGIVPVVGSVHPDRIRDAVRADALELSREEWYAILLAARGAGLLRSWRTPAARATRARAARTGTCRDLVGDAPAPRSTPSRTKPRRSSARLEASLRGSVSASRRRRPSGPNA